MTAISPAAAAPPGGQQPLSVQQNSNRLLKLAQALASLSQLQVMCKVDTVQLFTLFVSLARGIDYAVVNNDVPADAEAFPVLFKQLCKPKKDSLLQSANMVVILSIKNACKVGWFSDKETQELLKLAHEVESSFFYTEGIICGPGNLQRNVSDIIFRYYPSMKMGNILAYMEAKPGYQALMSDFHISRNEVKSGEDKLWLLVAQMDNIETSACIVTPQDVNFLVNGKGVEKRVNVFMDSGPQMPTDLTTMLKFGSNLLQAVGQFKGHYIIVVAFMNVVSLPNAADLSDYVHSDLTAPDSDPDLIVGPSRILLSCPISRARIKIPVKGAACKHLQCFDFINYVDINTRRPSWRCPLCNRHVCFSEIRIDQNMVKVLKEVSEDTSEVIIYAEGSWKAVESDDSVDRKHDKIPNVLRDGSQQEEPTRVSNTAPEVLDLTRDDNEMDVDALQNQSTARAFPTSSQTAPQQRPRTSQSFHRTAPHYSVPQNWNQQRCSFIPNQPYLVQRTPEMPSHQNWRPANRMRGSLVDRDYPSHLREYIVHPTNLTSPPIARPRRVPLPPGLQPYFDNGGSFRLPLVQEDVMTMDPPA